MTELEGFKSPRHPTFLVHRKMEEREMARHYQESEIEFRREHEGNERLKRIEERHRQVFAIDQDETLEAIRQLKREG